MGDTEHHGRGRGKVILLGEHSVVYGRPALAAGLERGVAARARPAEADAMALTPWDVRVKPEQDEPLALALRAALGLYARSAPAELAVEVGLPGGAGLGCSAAIGVAVIDALDGLYGVERTPAERGEVSLVWEKVFHGSPSGIDNAVAAAGGVVRFVRGEGIAPVAVGAPLPLVVAHSGVAASTKVVVGGVRERWEADAARMDRIFDAIAELVGRAETALAAGALDTLGELMNANQTELEAMGVSTPELEALCRTARDAGALGAKLTGAGGGGCMVALAEDADAAERIRARLAETSKLTFTTTVRGA
ncbi:MAG: mevalonate kinase [Myxococcota bacterium]